MFKKGNKIIRDSYPIFVLFLPTEITNPLTIISIASIKAVIGVPVCCIGIVFP
jgi:hypothetical protein